MSALMKWNPLRKSDELEEWGPLARWSPLRGMERIQNRMESLFRNWPAWPGPNAPLTSAEWAPLVDITEDDKEYLVKAEVPEVKREDLKVTVEDGTLRITGERRGEKEEKGKRYHRIERAYGSFERSFTLPDDADATKVTSDFKDGVLQVHMPKNPTAKPRATEVKIQ